MSKKQCIIYANCQGSLGLKPLLESHQEFNDTYNVKYISNFESKDNPTEDCDLFIYQNTKWLTKLPENCIHISFPYIYDDGTFPVHHGTGGFRVIEELIQQGLDPVKLYDEGKIDFKLKERKQKSLEILKDKEKSCTIKISDFLESEQGSRVPLFFTHNHPTVFVTVELTNRILAHIGMSELHPMTKCVGWLGGFHLDATGFCHYPGNKHKCIELNSMLTLDSYSLQNQKRIFNFQKGVYEDFYVVDNRCIREKIIEYIKRNESS